MKFVFAACLALFLSACASTGVKVTEEQASKFMRGQSTQSEVQAALGKPTMAMRNADGTRTLIYSYAHARTRGATFIPIVGAFAGGVDTRTNQATFTFDEGGKLLTYSTSEGQTGTGLGASAGSMEPVQDQPRQ